MAEIKTGEGKSITLGVNAILFTLFEYEVDVVCYNKHLSERDFIYFQKLFEKFNSSNIKYNTINILSEHFINKEDDLRDLFKFFVNSFNE